MNQMRGALGRAGADGDILALACCFLKLAEFSRAFHDVGRSPGSLIAAQRWYDQRCGTIRLMGCTMAKSRRGRTRGDAPTSHRARVDGQENTVL
jgi:hypothetical protein